MRLADIKDKTWQVLENAPLLSHCWSVMFAGTRVMIFIMLRLTVICSHIVGSFWLNSFTRVGIGKFIYGCVRKK